MTNKAETLQQLFAGLNKAWDEAGQLYQVAAGDETELIAQARLLILDAYLIFRNHFYDIPGKDTGNSSDA